MVISMNKKLKTGLIIFASVLGALLLVVIIYAIYVFAAYSRVEDNLSLTVENSVSETVKTEKEYKILTYNIGFGAYEDDYSFFMSGGKNSWAVSKEALIKNIDNIKNYIKSEDADIVLLQEVDEDGTRTYHYNEREVLTESLSDYSAIWAENWNSPFLFYPLTEPHGKNRSGIITFSRLAVSSAVRISLPVEKSFAKIVDLDRCYTKSTLPVEGGGTLVLYNLHLSAYTTDGTVATKQLKIVIDDMAAEYAKGNYVVCGGDFNKDLLGDSSKYFGISGEEYTWAQPFPTEFLEGTGLSLKAAIDPENPVPSAREADAAYNPEQFVVTLDGFIVSDNVEVSVLEVVDLGFEYSDHNPIRMTFKLKAE